MIAPILSPALALVGLLMLAPVLVVLSWALLLILAFGALLILAAVIYFALTGDVAATWVLAVAAVGALLLLLLLRRAASVLFRRIAHPRCTFLELADLMERDSPYFGSKAVRLGRLGRMGHPIPDGYAVSGRLHQMSISDAEDSEFNIPARYIKRLKRMHRRLVGDSPAIVRSSFAMEDLASGTASGVFDSVRIDSPSRLEWAIDKVWRSAYSENALSFAPIGGPRNLALFVHKLAGGDWIGRLMTSDPATGAQDVVRIEACKGDRYDTSQARPYRISPQSLAPFDADGPPPRLLERLARIGLRQAARLGGSVEIEWCTGNSTDPDGLTLLQVRPAPRERSGTLWINSGAVELLTEALSPLGRDLIEKNLPIGKHLEIPLEILGWDDGITDPEIQWIHGRPYVNADFVGKLMRTSQARSRGLSGLLAFSRLKRINRRWPADFSRYEAHVESACERAASVGDIASQGAEAVGELIDLVYSEGMRLHVVGSFIAEQFQTGLRVLADAWGVETDSISANAAAGAPGNRLERWRIALHECREILDDANSGNEKREHALKDYLENFGHRAPGEVEISNPRPATDSEVPLPDLPNSKWLRLKEASALLGNRAAHLGRGHLVPWERLLLIRTFRRAVEASPYREAAKDALLKGMAALRALLLKHGEDLAGRGLVKHRDDVFLLRLDELQRSWQGELPDPGELDARRDELKQWRAITAPPTVAQDPDGKLHPLESDIGVPVSPGQARGKAATPGQAGPDDILVLPSPDVASAGDLNVAGIVCVTGSALCHLGQLAREKGLPMVVAVRGAMGWQGRIIEIDGWSGAARPQQGES